MSLIIFTVMEKTIEYGLLNDGNFEEAIMMKLMIGGLPSLSHTLLVSQPFHSSYHHSAHFHFRPSYA
jgi:hypothetical protein